MKKKIVVVDDDKDILDVMQFILDAEGYEVVMYDHIVTTAEIAGQRPAVILLDNKLAGVYSGDFCVALKQDNLTKAIPVIIVSASEQIETITRDCSADAFLSKPFDLKDFTALVKQYADGHNSL